jgi:diguanylate cyclase (GGDEF)-like protein
VPVALSLAGFAVLWGLVELWLAAKGRVMAIRHRALVTAATMPIVALALWATGGATSFLQPIMFFTALFISYFFPARLAWPLIALFVYAYATPLFYDERAVNLGYPGRLAMFVLAVSGAMLVIQFLKGQLVKAESHQRAMAERDPLTGVSNRRAFDAALERAAATGEPYALILIDLDDFKRVNDEEGHPAGDEVLRSVGRAAAQIARQGDCVARIGGDEFAVLAPGAGPSGVLRLLRDLRETIEHPATFAAGLVPDDARTPDELIAHADARLLSQKRDGKQRQSTLSLLERG